MKKYLAHIFSQNIFINIPVNNLFGIMQIVH